PVHVTAETSIIAAQSMMKGHDVRHLPVVDDGAVVGVIREQDLELAATLTASTHLPVGRLCVHDPLVVETDESLEVVVRRMAALGHDAAVVLRQGRLAGIVTTTDITQFLWRDPDAPLLLAPALSLPPFASGPPDDGAA
ncbi:MAG: CBS domain-containing protein, partial [Myxococcota bacterium]